MDQNKTIAKFEVGKTYETRSPCDSGYVVRITVLRRTDKTVTFRVEGGDRETMRPYVYQGAEVLRPLGNYSMCPIVRAEVLS